MINAWVLILFNLIFTSVPPLIYGVLDQDSHADTLMAYPELYQAAKSSGVSGLEYWDFFENVKCTMMYSPDVSMN